MKYNFGLLSRCGNNKIIFLCAERVQLGCTLGNIKIVIRAPRPCRDGGPPSTLCRGPRYRLPYGLRSGVRRHCALAHVPVRPGAGQKNNSTIVNFFYETMHPKRIKRSPVQRHLVGAPQRKIGFSPQLPLWGHPAQPSKCD